MSQGEASVPLNGFVSWVLLHPIHYPHNATHRTNLCSLVSVVLAQPTQKSATPLLNRGNSSVVSHCSKDCVDGVVLTQLHGGVDGRRGNGLYRLRRGWFLLFGGAFIPCRNLLPMEKCSIFWTIRVGAFPVLYPAANVEWLQFSLLLVGLVAAKRTPTLLDSNVNNIACVCRVLRTIAGVVPLSPFAPATPVKSIVGTFMYRVLRTDTDYSILNLISVCAHLSFFLQQQHHLPNQPTHSQLSQENQRPLSVNTPHQSRTAQSQPHFVPGSMSRKCTVARRSL